MPNNAVKSIAKETNKSVNEVEKLWGEAKKKVEEDYNDVSKGSKRYYQLTTEITKKKAGMKNEAEDGEEEEEDTEATDKDEEGGETNEASCGNKKMKKESKKKYKKESEEEEDSEENDSDDDSDEEEETNESGKKKKKESKSYKESVEKKDFQTLLNENLEIVNTLNDNVINESVSTESEVLNESVTGALLVTIGTAGVLSALFYKLEKMIQRQRYSEIFEAFIAEEDQRGIVRKKMPQTIKKAKLITSLSDLNEFERDAQEIVDYLDGLEQRVDPFFDKKYAENPDSFISMWHRDPEVLKQRFRKELRDFIHATQESFDYTIEQKRDEILG